MFEVQLSWICYMLGKQKFHVYRAYYSYRIFQRNFRIVIVIMNFIIPYWKRNCEQNMLRRCEQDINDSYHAYTLSVAAFVAFLITYSILIYFSSAYFWHLRSVCCFSFKFSVFFSIFTLPEAICNPPFWPIISPITFFCPIL